MCSRASILAIYTAPSAGAPMQLRTDVHAVPGRGLVGDRYFTDSGRFSAAPVPGREVTELTLIESDVIQYLRLEWGLEVEEADSRRNLVTRAVHLNDLIGVEFHVGEVRLRGAGLCEPCVSLVKSPAHRHLLRALAHKGGLRAQILSEGPIAVGDPILVSSRARAPAAPPASAVRFPHRHPRRRLVSYPLGDPTREVRP
jgi:MOSC domain-containing protein YiiM